MSLVSDTEFRDALQRIRNLAGNVVLPTTPDPNPPYQKQRPELYVPDFNWLYAGACRAMNG